MSYNEIVPNIYLGNFENHKYCQVLQIKYIINVSEYPLKNTYYYPIMLDNSVHQIKLSLLAAIAKLTELYHSEEKILIYCTGELSRSAIVILGFLMSNFNMTLGSAIYLLRKRRTFATLNPKYLSIVRELFSKNTKMLIN